MLEKEYIILLGFSSIQEGVDYMSLSPYTFAFSVGGVTYDFGGSIIDTPNDSSIINEGHIFICNHSDPLPGSLYIDDDFLKYYKEISG